MRIPFIFFAFFGILTVVFAYTPSTPIEWVSCTGPAATRALNHQQRESLRIHSPSLSLEEFKTLFVKNLEELKEQQRNFRNHPLAAQFQSIDPKLPATEAEWASVQAYYTSSQCALPKLPLIWDDPTNDKYTRTFAKRFLAKKQPAKAQLWILEGGPGGPGAGLEALAGLYYMGELNDDVDIYVPDQRGVGRSDPLECPSGAVAMSGGDPTKIKACLDALNTKYGPNGLFGFSGRHFAHDIAFISNYSKPIEYPQQKVIIYGVSYGTFLVNQAMAQFPDYFDAVIADSAVSLTQPWEYRDVHFLDMLEEFIKTCENSAFCSGKFASLGTTPRKAIATVLMKQQKPAPENKALTDKKCHGVFTVNQLRSFLAQGPRNLNYRKLLMPLIYRMYRCIPEKDDTFVSNFWFLVGSTRSVDSVENVLLKNSTTVSRINSMRTYTEDEKKQMEKTALTMSAENLYLVGLGDLSSKIINRTMEDYEDFYGTVPPYGRIAFKSMLNTFINTQKAGGQYNNPYGFNYATNYKRPLLLMHSTLDTQTPKKMGEDWINVFSVSNPNFHYLMFNNSLHGQIITTPMAKYAQKMPPTGLNYATDYCGGVILMSFVRNIATYNMSTMSEIRANLNASCFYNQEYYEAVEPDFQKTTTLDYAVRLKLQMLYFFPNFDTLDLWEDVPRANLQTLLTLSIILAIILLICCCPCICCCSPCIIIVLLLGFQQFYLIYFQILQLWAL